MYCLGEKAFQYLYKLKKIDKETITYKLKFIDSYRFMQSSLGSLVDNLSEII